MNILRSLWGTTHIYIYIYNYKYIYIYIYPYHHIRICVMKSCCSAATSPCFLRNMFFTTLRTPRIIPEIMTGGRLVAQRSALSPFFCLWVNQAWLLSSYLRIIGVIHYEGWLIMCLSHGFPSKSTLQSPFCWVKSPFPSQKFILRPFQINTLEC